MVTELKYCPRNNCHKLLIVDHDEYYCTDHGTVAKEQAISGAVPLKQAVVMLPPNSKDKKVRKAWYKANKHAMIADLAAMCQTDFLAKWHVSNWMYGRLNSRNKLERGMPASPAAAATPAAPAHDNHTSKAPLDLGFSFTVTGSDLVGMSQYQFDHVWASLGMAVQQRAKNQKG